jgi:Fe-S cluster biogenesis protein NfuA
MTTKMVVQRKLRELIHPELNVVNVDGTPENALPEHYYRPDTEEKEEETVENEGLLEKVKKLF